ncbi:DUF2637 domain-containing protein [Streptomyces rubiginosohelvolus]|uniref:DUF2637 domain-containing protein n=1 Tax=Streptomyces rubiginosohelvolus TaxID=67362 RepID=A0ABQ3BI25_9ACTN|nr:DUF2637 domain-containing protein [Streptomyces pluricolorescens]GGZ42519.1 hypothetical protein GCM10010328_15550 [Streptomyces pluricolorescens]
MKRSGKVFLVAALVVVVCMAFRVSWNALRDVARAIGADETAANFYPFVIDGLMALALIATLVLVGRNRQFALKVLGGYTVASLVLNYVHGLVPALHEPVGMVRLADWDGAHYALVFIATSLPVGAIFFGSDLVAKVLHHRPTAEAVRMPDGQEPAPAPHTPAHPAQTPALDHAEPPFPAPVLEPSAQVAEDAGAVRESDPHTARTPEEEMPEELLHREQFEEAELERMRQDARRAYVESAQAGRPLSARALGEAFGMSESWGRKQILAVRDDEEAPRPRLRAVEVGAV